MRLKDHKELLRRLRDMPPPSIPPGLEARLLADVPTRANRCYRLAFVVGAGGAIAAGLFVLLMLRPETSDPAPSPTVASRDVQPEFVQQTSSPEKETRPCDILPALPRSL